MIFHRCSNGFHTGQDLDVLIIPSTSKYRGSIRSHTRTTTTNFIEQQQILLKIRSITNYISYPPPPPQIAYKLIEAGRSKDILKVQGLSIDGLSDNKDTIIQ